jgi:hypothetical protein
LAFSRNLIRSAIVAVTLVALANCGSRTGLFVDLPDLADSAFDAESPDALPDVGNDAPDALPDVRLDAPDDGPLVCVPGTFTFALATPQLMFVLDRSGSMKFFLTSNTEAPPGPDRRWDALHNSLTQTIVPFTDQISMGARFFPAVNADAIDPVGACIQDPPSGAILPALGNAQTILNVFDSTSPVGGTPTAAALQQAAQEVSVSRAVARAMVVATDGAPNCNSALNRNACVCTTDNGCNVVNGSAENCLDDTRTIDTIASIANQQKIPVFVVGIGVTASFGSVLDQMALAGGRPRAGSPRYYPATTPAELTTAFTAVRDSVAKCSYITPSSPNDPDAIVVTINGVPVSRDTTHADGWDWIDQAYGHLQLFGAACDLATATNVTGTIECDKDAGSDASTDQ